jgi:hypothetical protein
MSTYTRDLRPGDVALTLHVGDGFVVPVHDEGGDRITWRTVNDLRAHDLDRGTFTVSFTDEAVAVSAGVTPWTVRDPADLGDVFCEVHGTVPPGVRSARADELLSRLRTLAALRLDGGDYTVAEWAAMADDLAETVHELDAHLSAGGTPPEAWSESPDAPHMDEPTTERFWIMPHDDPSVRVVVNDEADMRGNYTDGKRDGSIPADVTFADYLATWEMIDLPAGSAVVGYDDRGPIIQHGV